MTICYAPILRSKAGEFKAVKELSANVRQRVAPLFDFDLPDQNKDVAAVDHLRKAIRSLKKCNPPSVIFADAFHWPADAEVETGEHVITFLLSTMRAEGLTPIPTIGYDRWGSPEYRLAITNVGPGPEGRYAIRLDRSVLEDMYNPDQVVSVLEDMLTAVNTEPNQCVIFVDLEDLFGPQNSVASFVSECGALLDAISSMGFSAYVIAGSSVPSMINDAVPTPDSTSQIFRKEQLIWRALRVQYPQLPIVAGDYGVRGPTSYSGPNKHMNGKIRHTVDRIYYVARGHSIFNDHSYIQMHALAHTIVHSGHYLGPAYSWGDGKIAEAAAHQFTGNMSSWIAVDTNHHIHFLIDEVIGFELTAGELAEAAI